MICKNTIEELFELGEIIPGNGSDEMALCIAAIGDEHIHLTPTAPAADPIILEYSHISEAIDAASGTMSGQQGGQLLQCFVEEYLRRVEAARRDAEVEAMWLSAGACQIQ